MIQLRKWCLAAMMMQPYKILKEQFWFKVWIYFNFFIAKNNIKRNTESQHFARHLVAVLLRQTCDIGIVFSYKL